MRTSADEIVWIDAKLDEIDGDARDSDADGDGDAFFSFHTISAWDDEDGNVVLSAMRMPGFAMDFELGEVNRETVVCQWTLDVAARRVVASRTIFETPSEFPVINEAYRGRRNRFAYVALQGPRLFHGVAKLDLVELRYFFSTFYSLPPPLWRGFLSHSLDSASLVSFALTTFAYGNNALRLMLLSHLTDGSGAGTRLLSAYLPAQLQPDPASARGQVVRRGRNSPDTCSSQAAAGMEAHASRGIPPGFAPR